MEEYTKQHANLVIVRNQYNRKLGGARNAGMEVAKGKYIWFVDSDDFISTDCVKKLLLIAEKDDLDVLHFDYTDFPISPVQSDKIDTTNIMTGPDMFFNTNLVWHQHLVTAWSKIYRHQFLKENRILFAEQIMFEDNDYAIEVFAKAKRVKHIEVPMYFYRNNPESITRTKYTSVHVDYWLKLCHRLCKLRRSFIKEQRDERFQSLIHEFIRYLIGNVLQIYLGMDEQNRRETSKIIRGGINFQLYPYMSKYKFFKIKIGLD